MAVFSATLDPIVHLNPRVRVDVYVTGGGGLFHRYQEFTAPTVSVVVRLRSVLRIHPGRGAREPGAGELFRQ